MKKKFAVFYLFKFMMFQVTPHAKRMRSDLKHHELFASVCGLQPIFGTSIWLSHVNIAINKIAI